MEFSLNKSVCVLEWIKFLDEQHFVNKTKRSLALGKVIQEVYNYFPVGFFEMLFNRRFLCSAIH